LNLPAPPLDGGTEHAESVGRVVDGQIANVLNAVNRDGALGLPSRIPCVLARWRPASTRSRMRSRSNSAHVKLQLAGWRAIDALSETDERDADAGQFFQHRHKVSGAPPEPVQSPTHQNTELPTVGVRWLRAGRLSFAPLTPERAPTVRRVSSPDVFAASAARRPRPRSQSGIPAARDAPPGPACWRA